MKNIGLVLFFMLFCLSFSISHAEPRPSKKLTKVVLQLMWKHQFEFAGFYAAIEQGYYRDIGLEVELREYRDDINLVDEVVSGRGQFGISDSSLIINKSQGSPVVLLANIFQHSPMILLSRIDSGIYSPAQMVGKSIMLPAHEKDNASIMAMLNIESVSLQHMTLKQHSFNIDDFINGKVDIISAYATNEPGILKERQFKFNIIDPINYGIDFYGNNIFTSEQYLQDNPQQVADFIAASLKGWQYALANSNEIIELILTKYSTQKTRAELEYEAKALHRFILPEHIPLGTIDAERIDRIVDTYQQLQMIPKNFKLKDFIYRPSELFESALQLSAAEQLWIKQHPQITIGVDPRWPPFEFIDKQGQYSGMGADYIKLIAEKTGLKFIVPKNKTWKDVLNSARSDQLDLLPAIMASAQRKEYLDFSKPHIIYPMVIVTRKSSVFISDLQELHNKQVAVVAGYVTEDILRANHPSIQLKSAKYLQQALKWVASGEVDALIDNLASVTYAISKMGITNLRISGTTPYEFALAIAVPKGHEMLLAIIQKALDSITSKQKQAIQQQWVAIDYEQGFDYKQYFYISLVALLVILAILLWNWSLAIEIKARKNAENALHESQALLVYKNNILELLSKGCNLHTIFTTLITYLEAAHPEMIVSILLLDKQKQHLINGVAVSLPAHYMQAIDGVAIGFGVGSCGTAAFTGEQVIVEDIMTHPYWQDFKGLAKSARVRACWSQPIRSSHHEILGTFAIYYRQPTLPSKENLKLIHEFSVLAALIIDTFQNNEQLKKLSLAVTQSANMVVITDRNGIIEYVNPKFTEITGYSSEEVIGNTPRLLKSGDTDELAYVDLWHLLLSGKKWEGEFLNRKKNGQSYWVWESIAPIKDDSGEITHFVAVQMDYTERKKSAKALQDSENRFRQLFEGANDLIFIINPQTRQFIEANENAAHLLGYTRDELLQLKVSDLDRVEDGEFIDGQFQALRQTGNIIFEHSLLRKDGSAILVEISAKAVIYNESRVIQAVARDIGERKVVENKLIASEAQFRALVENTNIVAWKLDLASFCFTYVSPHAEKMLGYPIEEWKQEGFWVNHIVSADRDRSVNYCLLETQKGLDHNFDYRMCKANGESIWLRDIVTVNKNAEGMPISLSGFLIDIDERKKAETALKKAKLEAERANHVKSEFLATMTHELRTPMNGVLGMAQILEETELSPEQRENVDIIVRSGNSLLAIINDVLDLSKLEEQQVILEKRVFDLGQVIDDTLAIIRPKMVAKSLDLKIVYSLDDPHFFVGDSTRVQQIVLNLMSNALKFTEAGYIRFSVICSAAVNGQVAIKILIEDTGIGVATENIAHLFDPFVQADQTTTRRFGGSGLGLAICKKLINLMQGEIGVNSILGQGTEFWVTFSLPLAVNIDAIQEPSPITKLSHTVFNGNILIVEDDLVNQQIATSMLKKSGLLIHIAENGQQALELWQQGEYDLILMDCRMPIMDGYDATKKIRAQESGQRIPIIALTANSSHGDRQRCLASGMDAVITKPFKKEVLLGTLAKWWPAALQNLEDNVTATERHILQDALLEPHSKYQTLDSNLLVKLKQEMAEDFAEIYATILQTIEDIMQQLENDLAQMPDEEIVRLAHSLKSPTASLGAIQLNKMAAEFELAADNNDLTDKTKTVAQLKQEYNQVLRALDKVVL